jgi:signal transduction histidine kinase
MTVGLRKTGIRLVGNVPWGTHYCLFYETKDDLLATVVPYFKAGMESGEFCLWAVSAPLTEQEAAAALRDAVPDFDRYVAERSIEIFSAREWYLDGDRFDLERITGGWQEKLHGALARGYEGMRISGNSFWGASKHWKSFCDYERALDESVVSQPMTVLCTYPLTGTSAGEILEVVRAHQAAIGRRRGDWEVVEAPELKEAKQELKLLSEELERGVAERVKQLTAANQELLAQIAERKRTEEELRRSEAQLAEAQRLTHTGSWTWTIETGKLRWSRELFLIFGFDPAQGEPSYQSAVGRIHPEDWPSFDRALVQTLRDRRDFDLSFRILLPDGSIKFIQAIGRPAVNDAGELDYVGTVMDVSGRRRADEALRDAQAELARVTRITAMGELAASIAHEINQPLAAVVTNSDASLRWLSNDPPDLEEARAALRRTVRDANRASDVIKRIRALITRDEPAHAELDLNDVIGEVLALTQSEIDRRNVTVQTDLPGGLPPIRGDRVQLRQVILNLILNALEAIGPVTSRPRALRISSQTENAGAVLVSVEDSGVGLDPTTAGRLFEPFFTTKPGGVGMGLAISRSIIEAHGGRVWASPGAAHGAVFRFSLPSATDGAS